MQNTKGRLVEAYTNSACNGRASLVTDEWFGYSSRGETTDLWEGTPHSGGYYHMAATYWANGVPNVITAGSGSTYTMTWNVDGEGRVYSTTDGGGGHPLASTAYNAASLPTQLNFSSGDSDVFTYDPNTNRMTKYQYNINGQTYTGTPTWNANGTLASLGISDPFNSANNQNCIYTHDDLVRIASVNCGASTWQQNFTYDAFGNITKTVPAGGTGNSFQPTYSSATNHITNLAAFTPTYDADGRVTNDSNHTYSWDIFGNPTTIDGVGVTYDAFDRPVEQNRSGVYSEITYSPTGFKLQFMNGTPAVKDFVPLPGGVTAVYSVNAPSGGFWFRHPDWLGNSRLASNPNRTVYYDGAYAPFGEPYAQTGTSDLSFTGMNQDTSGGLYDFPAREYSTQGRWASPDPAGLAAVDTTNPQSWNRYAYVTDNPLSLVDPLGLDDCSTSTANTCVQVNGGGNSPGWWLFYYWYYYFAANSASGGGSNTGGGTPVTAQTKPPTRSVKYYLRATSDCGNGGDREIRYTLMQEAAGPPTPAMNFTVQEHIKILLGTLFSFGAPQGPDKLGNSGYHDYISGSGTRSTWQTFTAWQQGGPQESVFVRDVYGHDYGTNGVYVQGAHGAQPAQIFVNNIPTPPGKACVYPNY